MKQPDETGLQPVNYTAGLVGASSDKGPVRPDNEDAFWVPDGQTAVEFGALYIVADGVGGQEDGATAARIGSATVQETFYRLRREGQSPQQALENAIIHANRSVYEEAQSRGGRRMGCTLVAAVLADGKLHVAHVGDARAYVMRNGKLHQLTRDDTWVQKQVDAGLITPEQAAAHELRNVVTQVLGNKLEVTVNHSRRPVLVAGDSLLLCSDGLYDTLDKEQIIRSLADNPPPEAARVLIDEAVRAEAGDNITAVVVGIAADNLVRELPPPVAAPAPRPWLMMAVVAALVIAAAALLIGVLLSRQAEAGNPLDADGTLEPGQSSQADGVAAATQPATSPEAAQQPTSTLRPTEAATATPEPTLPPSATPVIEACVSGETALFVWRDDQLASDSCDQFAQEGFVMNPGEKVLILVPEITSVRGPDASCTLNEFIKVRSLSNPDLEGWVLNDAITPVPTGSECNP